MLFESTEIVLGIDQGSINVRTKGEPKSCQLVLDFVEGLLTKIPILEHLSLGLDRQLSHSGDIGIIQTVGRTNAQLNFVDAHVEKFLHPRLLVILLINNFFEFNGVFIVTHEDIQVMLKDGRGLRQGIIRTERPSVVTSRIRLS